MDTIINLVITTSVAPVKHYTDNILKFYLLLIYFLIIYNNNVLVRGYSINRL